MRVAHKPRDIVAAKRQFESGIRARFRWKLRDLSAEGLQHVYDRAKELGRRDVMNWCMMEAGRRLDPERVSVLNRNGTTAEGTHAS